MRRARLWDTCCLCGRTSVEIVSDRRRSTTNQRGESSSSSLLYFIVALAAMRFIFLLLSFFVLSLLLQPPIILPRSCLRRRPHQQTSFVPSTCGVPPYPQRSFFAVLPPRRPAHRCCGESFLFPLKTSARRGTSSVQVRSPVEFDDSVISTLRFFSPPPPCPTLSVSFLFSRLFESSLSHLPPSLNFSYLCYDNTNAQTSRVSFFE
ncbi:hypothetical protein SCHPADRAFT_245380 [Schizopora paradoxa]|uniref:Uncharacterized protein n=1 Tax=Schizopora paradoxa TaxID=27342 RepID=A0A0H2S221_9AGAM|nr:hypothetical protein SCHPADRAFT_245380 [Schizopora paradoxa]